MLLIDVFGDQKKLQKLSKLGEGEVIFTKSKRKAAFFRDVFPYNKECKEEAALEEQPQLFISQPNTSSSQKTQTRKPEEDKKQKPLTPNQTSKHKKDLLQKLPVTIYRDNVMPPLWKAAQNIFLLVAGEEGSLFSTLSIYFDSGIS